MERRQMLASIGGIGSAGVAGATSLSQSNLDQGSMLLAQAAAPAAHDHMAMMAAPAAPRKYDTLVPAYQACSLAAQICISHCQQLLAQGDKSLGACLGTALDTEVASGVVLKFAGLNSKFTPAFAKQSIAVLQACVEACKEHVEHHAECKACHDACIKAIDAAKAVA